MSTNMEATAILEPVPADDSTKKAAVDRVMLWLGDRLNPILVKETRQALKSKQFTITFMLLLLCGWVWSILGVTGIGPNVRYGAYGATMFYGYYFILSFPLLVIVPFGAFRSLASEQEDGTYELMSITALGPSQIVRGKLTSAVMQMIIYLSAISPCLAFTYLLRGIDFLTIFFILAYLTIASFGFTMIGLFLGTFSTQRHWQVVLSVVMIAGLVFAFVVGAVIVAERLDRGFSFSDSEFWLGNAGFATGFASYAVLVFFAAVAQITFASDNRATRLRIAMLLQYALFTAWMAWCWIADAGDEDVLVVFMAVVLIHWWLYGAMMTGESPVLSSRVKRRLPQSFLGRTFLTWFNPGPGTGYIMAIGNTAAAAALVLLAIGVTSIPAANLDRWRPDDVAPLIAFSVLAICYITIYLGVGLLLARLLRRASLIGPAVTTLMQVVLVFLGAAIPAMIAKWNHSDYSLLQITNPFWTLAEIGDRRQLPVDGPALLVILPIVALIVLVVNLPAIAREVRHVRIAKPKRVAQEDIEKRAQSRLDDEDETPFESFAHD